MLEVVAGLCASADTWDIRSSTPVEAAIPGDRRTAEWLLGLVLERGGVTKGRPVLVSYCFHGDIEVCWLSPKLYCSVLACTVPILVFIVSLFISA